MSELTDKMRTCAAAMLAEDFAKNRIYENEVQDRIVRDAIDLLIEAANMLEPVIDERMAQIENQTPGKQAEIGTYGEPMRLIDAKAIAANETLAPKPFTDDAWVAPGGAFPGMKNSGTRSKRACPQCGSFSYKRVFRRERQMFLHCGACGKEWLFSTAVRAS